jgi:hypothetical protein
MQKFVTRSTLSSDWNSPQYKRLSAFTGDLILRGPDDTWLRPLPKLKMHGSSVYHIRSLYFSPTLIKVLCLDYRRSDDLTPNFSIHFGADDLTFGYLGTTPDSQGVDALVNFVNHLNPTPRHQMSALSSIEWLLEGAVPLALS